jgi:hypothetical protein
MGLLNRKGSNVVRATMAMLDVIFGVDGGECGAGVGNLMVIGMVFAKSV